MMEKKSTRRGPPTILWEARIAPSRMGPSEGQSHCEGHDLLLNILGSGVSGG